VTWTATEGSHIFREWVIGPMWQASGTLFTGLDSDTIKAALFNNTGTPDNDVAVALAGYNAATSAWVTANEVTGASEWVAGGRALASKTFTSPAADTVMFDAADLTGAATITITNAYGCLVYDDTITGGTVADQGVSYHFFGGAQSVTAGTFSVLWHANGLNRYAL
jgi:hypothetical protein